MEYRQHSSFLRVCNPATCNVTPLTGEAFVAVEFDKGVNQVDVLTGTFDCTRLTDPLTARLDTALGEQVPTQSPLDA